MTMQIAETTISRSAVRLRCADQVDPAQASEWIDFVVSIADLRDPDDKEKPLAPTELQYLGGVQVAALVRARHAIDGEIQRLRSLARQAY